MKLAAITNTPVRLLRFICKYKIIKKVQIYLDSAKIQNICQYPFLRNYSVSRYLRTTPDDIKLPHHDSEIFHRICI